MYTLAWEFALSLSKSKSHSFALKASVFGQLLISLNNIYFVVKSLICKYILYLQPVVGDTYWEGASLLLR